MNRMLPRCSSHNGKRRLGTRKQPFLVVLSTERENQYSLFVKLKEMTVDSGENIEIFLISMLSCPKTGNRIRMVYPSTIS